MAVIAITAAQPHVGKRQMTENRARQLAGIYARHGAAVKVGSIISGPNTGCILVQRGYADFRSAAKAFHAINADPAHVEFWREREANPSADIVIARDLLRTVYGESRWGTHPMSHLRQYSITQDKMADAMKILPKVEKLWSKTNVNVMALVPVTGEDLSTMIVSYQFCSLDHWGEALDEVSTSPAFQALAAEAAKLGTLRASFGIAPL